MCRVILHLDESTAGCPKIVLRVNQIDLTLTETEADVLFSEMLWARDTLRSHKLDSMAHKHVEETI
jgi:hypothetical protein